MTSTDGTASDRPPTASRLLHSRLLPLALLTLAVAAGLTALVVEDDAADTTLGAVTGASVTLLLFVLLVQWLLSRERRRDAEEQDLRRLDGLEPLRAARRDSADHVDGSGA